MQKVEKLIRKQDGSRGGGQSAQSQFETNDFVQIHTRLLKQYGKDPKLSLFQVTNPHFSYVRKYANSAVSFVCIANANGTSEICLVPDDVSSVSITAEKVFVGLTCGSVAVYKRGKSEPESAQNSQNAGVHEMEALKPSNNIEITREFTLLSNEITIPEEKTLLTQIGNKTAVIHASKRNIIVNLTSTKGASTTLSLEHALNSDFCSQTFKLANKNANDTATYIFDNKSVFRLCLESQTLTLLYTEPNHSESAITSASVTSIGILLLSYKSGVLTGIRTADQKRIFELKSTVSDIIYDIFPSYHATPEHGLIESFKLLTVLTRDLKILSYELDAQLSYQLRSTIRICEHMRVSLGANENDFDSNSIQITCASYCQQSNSLRIVLKSTTNRFYDLSFK